MWHELSFTVAAPAETVWKAYTDPGRVPSWRPSVAAITELTGPMHRAGTAFITRYRSPLPPSRGHVLHAEPGDVHLLEGRALATYRAELHLAPEDGARTRLTFHLHARVPLPFMQRRIARETNQDFRRLKELIER